MSERTGPEGNGGTFTEPSQVAHATAEAVWRKSLADTAHRWKDIGRDSGILCHGGLLVHAMGYEDLDALEAEFVGASLAECLRQGQDMCVEALMTPQLVRILVGLLSDKDHEICSKAEYALERVVRVRRALAVPAIDGLIERLTGPAGPVRPRAAKALEEVMWVCPEQVTSQTVDTLFELLCDPDPEVCSTAAYTLERMAADRPDLAGQLVAGAEGLLADPCDAVRIKAARVLEAVVRARPEVVTSQTIETVAGLFRDASGDVCSRAQYILERVIATRPDLVLQIAALLDDLMGDAEVQVRARAVWTMDKVVQANAQAATPERVCTLARLCQEPHSELSSPAGYVLKRMAEIEQELATQAVSLGAGHFSYVSP
jgi:hypothetical protein